MASILNNREMWGGYLVAIFVFFIIFIAINHLVQEYEEKKKDEALQISHPWLFRK